jgi:hypothetical protein
MGVVAPNSNNIPTFAADPNEKKKGQTANDINAFGQSLMNAMGKVKSKPERLGTKQNGTDDVN